MDSTTIKPTASNLTLTLYVLAAVISIVYIALTYSPGFLSGNGSFWQMQTDDVGTYITGLRFYIRDQWRFPLFYTHTLNYPDGANIIFTDSLPLMALFAKIAYKAAGLEWNYFGHWIVISNILFGLSIIALLDSLKVRSIPICAIALLFGFSVFPYIARTFHIALSSHFFVILALALYFRILDTNRQQSSIFFFYLLLASALLVHFYLFILSFLIAAAALLTLYIRKRISTAALCLIMSTALLMIVCIMFCSGYITFDISKKYSSLGGAGKGSMNILSPFLPIKSFFFPNPPFRDPTGYQFSEGLNYLGLSVILLVLYIWIVYYKTVKAIIVKHFVLMALCISLCIFSLGNQIYFGSYKIVEIPLIPGVETLYKTLKAGGRFFWPSAYLLTFAPILIIAKKAVHLKTGLFLLFVLAIVQNIEIWPLRQQIRNRTETSQKTAHYSFYESLVNKHEVILSSEENIWQNGPYRNALRTLYFLAGQNNKSINFCYTARPLRHPTPFETLIKSHREADIPVLFVIPKGSKYTELLTFVPYQYEQNGILYASNQYPFEKMTEE